MPTSLLEALDRVADTATAVADGAESLTYGELRQQARQAGAHLTARYGDGQFIVVRAQPTVRFVVTMLGAMYGGNTPVPIAPDLPDPAVAYIRDKSRAAAVIDPLGRDAFGTEAPRDNRREDVPALVLFTSGTSGYAKGVVVSSANLGHSCAAVADYLEYERFPSAAVALPLHYSYALCSQVCGMLSVGGRVRLFSDLRNPLRFARAVNEEGLQTFCGVPSTYHAICEVHLMSALSMPGVRVLCSAGEALDRSRLPTIRQVFPNAVFFNNYGMTEAAPRISYIRDDDPRFGEPTCGRPMAGVDVRVVDPDSFEALPDGRPGMLVVKGPNISAGYLNDPELTAASRTADGYLISGDIAYLDRGCIFIVGRQDDIFNVGGEKVAPLEIEHILTHIPGVEAAAVAGVADTQRGRVPVAFLKLGAPLTRSALVAELLRHLPKAKVPLRFFQVTEFPTTSSGKLQRKRLAVDAAYVTGEIR